jgi:AhpD family alkylhydroperoxidase
MPFLPSLPADAGVRHILQMNKPAGRALIEFHQALLRSDSPLSAAQLELIAAYVSGLNACQYCYGVHSETAKAFGLAENALDALLADVDPAPVDPRMRPLLAYANDAGRRGCRLCGGLERAGASRCGADRMPVQLHEPAARRSRLQGGA